MCVYMYVVIAVYAKPAIIDAATLKMLNNCRKENNVSEKELGQYMANKLDAADSTHNFKCFVKCTIEKFGFYKNNMLDEVLATKFIMDNSKDKQSNEESVKDVIKKCNQMKGADACDTASQIVSCFVKAELKVFQ
ncbi:general odorant-binding protein 56d-like [Anastrepha ludens]|uniref:general odorant-binding protein 56d-like n=1 Tax=Anastrepha ludens TaxID=28586 RepID=UPI0023AE9D88|nr:general odorant-binding protein 56d-like [Anastrepha ludens]